MKLENIYIDFFLPIELLPKYGKVNYVEVRKDCKKYIYTFLFIKVTINYITK